MTDLVQTDKEAMSALKKHGSKIVWAIIIALAGYFGWQFYQKNYAKIDTVAADSYTLISEKNDALNLGRQMPQMDEATASELKKEQDALFADIDKLVANHGKTAYAWQALMIKAHHQSDSGDHTGAVETLKKANLIQLDDEGLFAIGTLRLAQATLATGDSDTAMNLVNQTLPKAFEPTRQELLGDIYVAKNDTDNAKKAYETAWGILSERGEIRSLLSLKMQAIGMTPTPIIEKSAVSQPAEPIKTTDEPAEPTNEPTEPATSN